VTAERLRVVRVEGVLGIDEGRDATGLLRVRNRMQRNRRLPARFRSVYLHDSTAGQATDPERDVEGNRPGGDHLDGGTGLVAEPHDGALAMLLLDLRERRRERLVAVESCHLRTPCCLAWANRCWTRATLSGRSDTFQRRDEDCGRQRETHLRRASVRL